MIVNAASGHSFHVRHRGESGSSAGLLQRLASIFRLGKIVWPIVFTLLAFAALPVFAAEGDFVAVPKLEKRVTDLTASLSAADEARISARIAAIEQKKGAQIAVLIVASTAPEVIFDYALRVAEAWKLGRKGVDDGLLFVVAKDDRKMQILTGPGLQGVMTDVVSRRIIAEIVAPRFREGDFAGGIFDAVDKISAVIDGEALPPPTPKRQSTSSQSGGSVNFLVLAVFAAIFAAPILRAMLGRFLGAGATAGITGAAAWFIAGGLLFPAVAGVIVFLVALLYGSGSGGHGGGGGIGGGFGGIGGGGWSGGGGGGGGFSGGGGGFDGGGASGDW